MRRTFHAAWLAAMSCTTQAFGPSNSFDDAAAVDTATNGIDDVADCADVEESSVVDVFDRGALDGGELDDEATDTVEEAERF